MVVTRWIDRHTPNLHRHSCKHSFHPEGHSCVSDPTGLSRTQAQPTQLRTGRRTGLPTLSSISVFYQEQVIGLHAFEAVILELILAYQEKTEAGVCLAKDSRLCFIELGSLHVLSKWV